MHIMTVVILVEVRDYSEHSKGRSTYSVVRDK